MVDDPRTCGRSRPFHADYVAVPSPAGGSPGYGSPGYGSSGYGPSLNDHWHEAYGIYECDHFLPPASNKTSSGHLPSIHTHDDGLIHIEPTSVADTGTEATLIKFLDDIGMRVTASGVTLPSGAKVTECGGRPVELIVYRWKLDEPMSQPDAFFFEDLADLYFEDNNEAYTLAIVSSDLELPPRPPSIPQLAKVGVAPRYPNGPNGPNGSISPNGTGTTRRGTTPGTR